MTDYEKWIKTFENVGISPLKKETCYKLMAWLLTEGGQVEVNYNTKLMSDLKFAQKQLNIVGGENPTKTTRQEIKKYTKEIENGKATWLKDLLEKYGVKKC